MTFDAMYRRSLDEMKKPQRASALPKSPDHVYLPGACRCGRRVVLVKHRWWRWIDPTTGGECGHG